MTKLMKVLIGYDGSECADTAIDDLLYAGLPERVEAMVVSVAEQMFPIPSSFGMVETEFSENLIGGPEGAIDHARQAASKIQERFQNWTVNTATGMGSPASYMIEKSDEWKPDLIVIGSHGRSVLGRLMLGSVSQKLVHEAHCSVRVARRRPEGNGAGVKLLIAIDGSKGSEEAAREVVLRQWPAGSSARLVNATWGASPALATAALQPIAHWMADEKYRIGAMMATIEGQLRDASLEVTSVVEEGDAKHVLLEEAETWKADCIFIGARGMGKVERFMLGSVSSAVAARAACSVEVVRRPN